MPRNHWFVLGLVAGGLCVVRPAAAEGPKPGGKTAAAAKALSAAKPGAPAKAGGTPAKAEAPPAQKKLGPPPDKATNAKVNAYIEVINEESEKFSRVRRDWLSQIDPKAGPTCKENVSIQQTIGPDGGRYDAYRKKLKAKPVLPADAGALKMVDAVEELRNLGKEPGPYTQHQGEKEPGSWCKKLKSTFPRMLAIFEKYGEGEREVRAYVDTFTDERDLRETQTTLKKYGKHYRYQFATLALEGKMMMREIGAELGKAAPDAGVIKQKFDSFFALTDETKAMMDNEPPKQKAEPFPQPFEFFLIESVPKIKRASASLLEAMAAKADKNRDERLDRNWRDVVAGYNNMITYMNQVHFETKQK